VGLPDSSGGQVSVSSTASSTIVRNSNSVAAAAANYANDSIASLEIASVFAVDSSLTSPTTIDPSVKITGKA